MQANVIAKLVNIIKFFESGHLNVNTSIELASINGISIGFVIICNFLFDFA